MNTLPRHDVDRRQCLSELLDGEADTAAQGQGLSMWATDAGARQTWHAYHLIGDVMRSEELASTPERDAAFLASIRVRLAAEPRVFAPGAARASRARSRRVVWAAPALAALSVVAVAGALVLLQTDTPGRLAPAPLLATAAPDTPTASDANAGRLIVDSPQGQMLRDARVDEYLRAHRSTLAGSPAALPGAAMRNVDLIVPQR